MSMSPNRSKYPLPITELFDAIFKALPHAASRCLNHCHNCFKYFKTKLLTSSQRPQIVLC